MIVTCGGFSGKHFAMGRAVLKEQPQPACGSACAASAVRCALFGCGRVRFRLAAAGKQRFFGKKFRLYMDYVIITLRKKNRPLFRRRKRAIGIVR